MTTASVYSYSVLQWSLEIVLASTHRFLCDIAMATSSSADMHWPSTRTLMGRRGRQNTQRQLLGATSSSADPTWKIGGWKQYPTHDPEEIHNSDWANNIYVSVSL